MNKNNFGRQAMHTHINHWAAWRAGVMGLALALGAAAASAQPATDAPAGMAAHADHAQHAGSVPAGPVNAASATNADSNAAAQVMTDGEVRRWDASTGKLTLRHAPIANLGMPAMTMVFVLQDKAAGDALSVGQRVRFHAERANGAMTITRIEAVR